MENVLDKLRFRIALANLIDTFFNLNPYIRKIFMVFLCGVIIISFSDTNTYFLSLYNFLEINEFVSGPLDLLAFKLFWGLTILFFILKIKRFWISSQEKQKWDAMEFTNLQNPLRPS